MSQVLIPSPHLWKGQWPMHVALFFKGSVTCVVSSLCLTSSPCSLKGQCQLSVSDIIPMFLEGSVTHAVSSVCDWLLPCLLKGQSPVQSTQCCATVRGKDPPTMTTHSSPLSTWTSSQQPPDRRPRRCVVGAPTWPASLTSSPQAVPLLLMPVARPRTRQTQRWNRAVSDPLNCYHLLLNLCLVEGSWGVGELLCWLVTDWSAITVGWGGGGGGRTLMLASDWLECYHHWVGEGWRTPLLASDQLECHQFAPHSDRQRGQLQHFSANRQVYISLLCLTSFTPMLFCPGLKETSFLNMSD